MLLNRHSTGGTMAEDGERTAALREDARNMRESVRREKLEEKLGEVVEERPAARSFLEPRPILIALAIAAVLTLITALLFSPQLGALVLVLSFALAWTVMSRRHYDQRRPTRDASGGADADGDGEPQAA
jgi:Flp pilus assembly protein TadB